MKKNIPSYQNLSLENEEGEVWKDIEDFFGLYQISNHGRVKSLKRKSKILKPIKITNLRVALYLDNKIYYKPIANLVYNAFKEKTENNIYHIDEDKTNNNINNLTLISFVGKKKELSKYLGVRKRKYDYEMYITINGKTHKKFFKTELEAAQEYDNYIKKYNLNRKGNFINK